MSRTGPINSPIQLCVNFYENGTLFDPYNVASVKIYDVATGSPTPLATLTPDGYSTGVYCVTWNALATSSSLEPGTYYDEWTWTGQSGMPSKSQRYSFTLTAATSDSDDDETTTTSAVTINAACRTPPSFIHRIGLRHVEEIGNGIGVGLAWEEARPADSNYQVFYNIYYADTRFDVFLEPKQITADRSVVINIPSGNVYYFAIRATEFDTDVDITEMEQVSANTYQYPESQTLLVDLEESADGYRVAVSNTDGFPSQGELLIGTELLRYTSIDAVNNEFVVPDSGRAINSTNVSAHYSGDTVELWHGIEDGNTIIRQGIGSWHNQVPRDTDAIGEYNVDPDGYRANNEDIVTTDLGSTEDNTEDFSNYDFCGYHRPSLQALFSGQCQNTYVGGEFNGGRGLFFRDRNLARLDTQLQVTGEKVILLKRKWTGKRCKCMGFRREHQRTRCGQCYGTGFSEGYDRYLNPRAISESFVNTRGFILVRTYPFKDDLEIKYDQGLIQPSEITAWTITVPAIKDRDIIIRFNEDGTEEFRYEILNVTRSKLLFGEVGRQDFIMRRMEKTDIIMTYDISTP